jgi:ABC-2 type transport system ATP-binding protein
VAFIQARGLSKTFSGKAAVRGLSFDVVPGSVTGFLGPNGAGKSTTMRLMLGLDNGEGVTTYDGVVFRELSNPLRQVGSVLDA